MDDDYGGFGNLAWYQMGRWSAEADQDRKNLVSRLRGCQPVARADYDQLYAEYDRAVDYNEQFEAANLKLNATVAVLRADYERLRVWADNRESEAKELKPKHEALVQLDKDKNLLLADLWNELEEMRERFGPLPPRQS